MPSYNITLDDTSPLWTYKNREDWSDDHPGDSEVSKYSNSTFHATNEPWASVSITFNGTGVHLYGALRYNHGEYSVAVAGERTYGEGYRHEPNTEADFRQRLFGKPDLPHALHNVEMTNEDTDGAWLDLDYGMITLGDGDMSTKSVDTIMDDRDSNITYKGDWDDRPNENADKYFEKTMHVVNVTGATAIVQFYGNAVTAFGAISSNHGAYTASLDGGTAQQFSGNASHFHAQQVLYLASSLPLTDHTLVLTHKDDDPKMFFDLDYVVVSRWVNSTDISDDNDDGGVPTGAIVGGAVGGAVFLALLGLLVWFFLRRRKHRASKWERAKFDVDPLPMPASASTAPPTSAPSTAGTAGTMSEKQRASQAAAAEGRMEEENRIRPLLVTTDSPPPEYHQSVESRTVL